MTKMKKVLITNAVPESALAPLAGVAEVIQGPSGGPLMSRAEVLALAPSLSGIINQAELRVDAELLDSAPLLEIVANVAIGTDNLDLPLMTDRGVWATNTPHAFIDSTADCTLGLMLSVARHLLPANQYVRSGQWQKDGFQPGCWDGIELGGKMLGIVGYGNIGRAVAQRAVSFGMKVIFHDPQQQTHEDYRDLEDLLDQSDFVSLHVPLTPQTHHLVSADTLRLMKPTAYLINMSRGPVVDEVALVQALEHKLIAGAALDVFEREPLVEQALLDMPNVHLSPHIGGGTHESREQARRLCAENVSLVLQGEVPKTPVNIL